MKALLRTLLLWFLLAGVPLQGFASATMLLCGPQPVSARTTATSSATSEAQAVTMQAAMHADGHHDHAAMLAAQQGAAAAHHDGAHHGADASHADHEKCASTGACCTGAPLTPALPAAPSLQDGRHATVPFVPEAPAAVDLAGPERPPKRTAA
ncbi:hypothetical protein [Pseudoduganella umbonata]|uniref:CopL family metal-binding regulatory protein n=1 Tax=Pseudoduganella umbonata TaxID=864828 RepID=A0A4V1ED19_9BURK|nr:hypothetical protein [Pseudoduganella umbonata]MBB3219452.1 hypothetical protein [Pseudoduganella umbonata]QCP09541.1 hypothetical protein FCL38_03215 [Pseudoduganella umbonata]